MEELKMNVELIPELQENIHYDEDMEQYVIYHPYIYFVGYHRSQNKKWRSAVLWISFKSAARSAC